MIIDMQDKWYIFQKDDKSWGNILKEFDESSFLNDIEWANHLGNLGWKTLRLIKTRNNLKGSKTLIQAFIKYLPFSTAIIWIPGGIIGDNINLVGFQEELKLILKARFCFIRIRCHQSYDFYNEINFFKNCWKRPLVSLSSRYKVILNLNNSPKIIQNNFSRGWYRSLKKSKKNNLKIIRIDKHEIIANLYKEMKLNKSLKQKNIYSKKECKSIMKAFRKKILVLGAVDESSNICSIRGVIIRDRTIYDIFAATNKKGRLYSASHLVIYSILKEFFNKDFSEYDLSNIDPENSFGVYNFKKGLGGKVIYTLGEFEWANSLLLKLLINLYFLFK
tara:strand:+ start:16345 stop:17343 length:999 start_codon:yes stop_codon:yes gene_type:complete